MVRSVTVFDEEWEPADTAAALEFAAAEADRCSGCNEPLTETMRPDVPAGAYYAEPRVCRGCAAVAQAQRAESRDGRQLDGVRWSVRDRSQG